jgi:hypothetical protein
MLRTQNDDLRAQRNSWQGIAERLAMNAPKQETPHQAAAHGGESDARRNRRGLGSEKWSTF